MKLLLALITVGSVLAVEERSAQSYGCLVKHLKAASLLEESFPDPSDVESSNCAELIEQETETLFYDEPVLQIGGMRKHLKCINRRARAMKWPESKFLHIVHSSPMSPQATKEKLNEIKLKSIDTFGKALFLCIADDLFADLLNITNSKEDEDRLTAFCLRQYVVEQNLIDRNYKVIQNPTNVDIFAANCDERLQKNKKQIEEIVLTIWVKEANCVNETSHRVGFSDKIFVAAVLKEVQLTVAQRGAEDNSLGDFIQSFDTEMYKCGPINE